MSIGLEPNDRRFGFWDWTVNEFDRTLTTQDLTRIFGIPLGHHLVIEHMLVLVSSGQNCRVTFDPKMGEPGEGSQFVTPSIDGLVPSMARGRTFVAIGAGDITQVPKFLDIPVYDNIVFQKSNDTWDFSFEIYYHFEPGAMMWLDEWAEMLADKYKVPITDTAGRIYNRVGDYYQMGIREMGFVVA